jgi:hypothetical protein
VTPKVAPLVSVARTGTVRVVITLTIESAISTQDPINCQAGISADDASFYNSASTSGTIVRGTTTGTLTLAIPYDWTMAAPENKPTSR